MADVNPWVADGNGDTFGAHLFKRSVGLVPDSYAKSPPPALAAPSLAYCEWGVNLKLATSLPPVIRVIGVGPVAENATNPVRQRAIRVRNALLAGDGE